MTAAAVLNRLLEAGIEVVPDGGNLRLRGNTAGLVPELRDLITAVKPGLISLLGARDRLRSLAESNGMDTSLADDVPISELSAYEGHTDTVLLAVLRVLAERRLLELGQVPAGWSEPVNCRRCGPVKLWPECPQEVIACPHCRIRRLRENRD